MLRRAVYWAVVVLSMIFALMIAIAFGVSMRGWRGLVNGALIIAVAALSLAYLRPGYARRVQPTWDEEFPVTADARIRPGQEFEWHPRGEPRIAVRHGIVHRWWDAERGSRYDARLSFDIPDEVPPKLLASATQRALKSATHALPSRGKVRASAAARDEPGPTSLVRVRLAVTAIGAKPEWTRVAAEAFAAKFLGELKDAGYLADRRSAFSGQHS